MRRVKITKLPQKRAGGQGTASNGYNNSVPEQLSNFGGADVRGAMDNPDISTRRTLKSVPRTEANVEAEKGEVAYGDINGDKFAESYVIGGKRHANGGTPLNLPEGTYIFSDFRDMKIKDPRILAMFEKINNKGKAKKAGGYTPAELAKSYDINKFRSILQDPNSDKNDIMTAELMIKNYQMKLGALALAAESKKNFEQGIPEVSRPYMEKMGIRDEDILPAEQLQHEQSETAQYEQMEGPESQEDMMQQMPMQQYGGQHQMPDGSWMPGAIHNDYMTMAQDGYQMPFDPGMTIPQYGGSENYGNQNWFDANQDSNAMNYTLGNPYKPIKIGDPTKRGFVNSAIIAIKQNKENRQLDNNPYERIPLGAFKMKGQDKFSFQDGGDLDWTNTTKYRPINYIGPKGGFDDPINPDTDLTQKQFNNLMHNMMMNNTRLVAPGKMTENDFMQTKLIPHYTWKNPPTLKPAIIPEPTVKASTLRPVYMQDGGQLKKYQNGNEVSNSREILPEEMTADELANTFAGNKDVANLYIDINSAFSDPTFRRIFVEQTRAALKEKERYQGKSKGQGKTWEDQFGAGSVDKLDAEEIIKAFVNHQKRNLALQAQGVDPRLYSDSNGTLMTSAQVQNLTYPGTSRKYTKEEAEAKVKQLKDKGYTTLNKTFSDLKLPLGDARQSRLEQATFHGYNRMLDHKGDYTKEEQALLEPWASDLQSGTADEPGETGERKRISPIDSVYTNTTAGHLVGRAVKKPDETVDETVTDTEDEVYNPGLTDMQGAVAPNDAPWWLQDSINIAGSVMDKSKIKDLYPWAPTPDLEEVQLMKTDPTRELAALSERYGTAANAMASIMPGQSYAANLRGMSGAGDIANTLARYNNQNVQIDNQEQLTNNSIRNQENAMRQGVAKQLYDDTIKTMANGQMQDLAFDREARGLLTQGISNKEQTEALNQMHPQYAVDPSIGGRMHFTQGKESLQPSKDKTFDWWFQQYKAQGMADKDAINAAKISSGQSSSTNGYTGQDMEAIMAQYAQLGGFISGYNTYPFEY